MIVDKENYNRNKEEQLEKKKQKQTKQTNRSMSLHLGFECGDEEDYITLDRIKDIVGVKTNKIRDLFEDIGELVCLRDGCEKTDPETGEPTGVMFPSYKELKAENKKLQAKVAEIPDLLEEERYKERACNERDWEDKDEEERQDREDEIEKLEAENKELKEKVAGSREAMKKILTTSEGWRSAAHQLQRRFDRAVIGLGEFATEVYSTDSEDEIEDNDPEEYGEYPYDLQPLDSGWAQIMGYDDATKGLFKLFDEFKPPVVEHPKELKEDYEKAGQAIGDCLEATTSFAWLIADYPQYANEVKVMCFAHSFPLPNPQSPDNNIRIHWVLVYKDFVVDCSNGQIRGIHKCKNYFAYLPTLLGSHTCKLSVYLGKLDKKYEVNQDNLYKYLGITMNEFYAKYLPEVECNTKKEIMKLMTKKD